MRNGASLKVRNGPATQGARSHRTYDLMNRPMTAGQDIITAEVIRRARLSKAPACLTRRDRRPGH
jgi:hypothetical protein